MTWSIVYLLLAIACVIGAVWRAAKGGNIFLVLTGFFFFLFVLFRLYLPTVYDLIFISGFPTLGRFILYIVIPICLSFSLFTLRHRR
jgi:hypothetical protein